MTDFRALCAELLADYEDSFVVGQPGDDPLVQRARAALAQPEPQEPTDDELYDLWDQEGTEADFQECRRFARAVLARWGSRTPAPIPLSERQPTESDCDAEGRCWWGRRSEELCNPDWFLATRAEVEEFCEYAPPVEWLPHWALPVPAESER